jgi:beta-phosphoglucomutase-like phosphatase (HAD superfamily)
MDWLTLCRTPMTFSPQSRTQLQQVLSQAFNEHELEALATEHFRLETVRIEEEINFKTGVKLIAVEFVRIAERHGLLEQLVVAVHKKRPLFPGVADLLAAVSQAFAQTPQAAGAKSNSPDGMAIRDAVIRFDEQFQLRQRLFGFLNAYKQWHDILHEIPDYLREVKSAMNLVEGAGDGEDNRDKLTDRLQDWVKLAHQSAKKAEFPNKPPKWIATFEKTANDLMGEFSKADPKSMDKAKVGATVKILAAMPNKEQMSLNVRLCECATRLETNQLISGIDSLLSSLSNRGVAAETATASFRQDVGEFRRMCQELTVLIEDHDCCQLIDSALQEGQAGITAEGLTQWGEIKDWISKVASRHSVTDGPAPPGGPTNGQNHASARLAADQLATQTQRLAESGAAFEQAKASGDLAAMNKTYKRLFERFTNMFQMVDKSLLEVTRDLIQKVEVLDAHLKGFQ